MMIIIDEELTGDSPGMHAASVLGAWLAAAAFA